MTSLPWLQGREYGIFHRRVSRDGVTTASKSRYRQTNPAYTCVQRWMTVVSHVTVDDTLDRTLSFKMTKFVDKILCRDGNTVNWKLLVYCENADWKI